MWTARTTRRLAAIGLGLLFLGATARAADEPVQAVNVGGATFDVPQAWKVTIPTQGMRKAQIKVEPSKGDAEPAEVVVFIFPGGAGGVEANVARWRNTFKDKDGNPPKVEQTTAKGKNTDVTRVEIAGHYFPTAFPGRPKEADHEGYRLLGAIATTDKAGYFIRLVGPDKTVTDAKPHFDRLIASFKVLED